MCVWSAYLCGVKYVCIMCDGVGWDEADVYMHMLVEVCKVCFVCVCVFSTGTDVPRIKTVEGGGLQDSLKLPGGT